MVWGQDGTRPREFVVGNAQIVTHSICFYFTELLATYVWLVSCLETECDGCDPTSYPVFLTFISMETLTLGLYRIYFLPIRPEPDFAGFRITVILLIMCKTLRTYEWFEFLILFCPAVIVTTFLISGFLTRLSYYSSKLSNVWEKSTFQIWQNYPAPVGFFAGAGFGKCRIPPYLTCDLCTDGSQRSFAWLALHLVV